MAIPSIDAALSNKSDAIKYLNSPDATSEGKAKIVAKYGAAQVDKWTSVDSTKYEISDDDFESAKELGTQRAKDSTGHDGSTHSTISTIGSAVGGAAVGAAGIATSMGSSLAGNIAKSGLNKLGNNVGETLAEAAGKKASEKAGGKTAEAAGKRNLGDIATVVLAAAVEAKYLIENPNKDQIEAAKQLAENELPQGSEALNAAQEEMELAEEESTELADEADETNNEANKNIDDKKTEFDFYRNRYNALKSKAESGEKLTPEEKALMTKLAPLMNNIGTEIDGIETETSDKVSGLSDEMGEYQDIFDESAETMADVEGVTDFAEGFDETTRTLCYVEGTSHTLNGIGAGLAAARLFSSGPWMWAFGAVGVAAAGLAVKSSTEQFKGASKVGNEIDIRTETQSFNAETTDMYDEKLDTYAALTEGVDELEIVVPEDLEVPAPPVSSDGQEGGGLGLGVSPNNQGNPNGVNGNNGANSSVSGQKTGAGQNGSKPQNNNDDKDDDNKKFFV